jgi:hypothetical protein
MSSFVFLVLAIAFFFACSLTMIAWKAIAAEADNSQWSGIYDGADVEDVKGQLAIGRTD